MPEIIIRVEGVQETVARLGYDSLIAQSLRDFLLRSAFTVEAHAKENAPVDTGRLRASISSEIEEFVATISPKVHYGVFVELGTRPHWPPPSALQPWAQRHGFPPGSAGAFLVARAISQHGTKPQPYMQPAAQQSQPEIEAFAQQMANEIEARWRS